MHQNHEKTVVANLNYFSSSIVLPIVITTFITQRPPCQ